MFEIALHSMRGPVKQKCAEHSYANLKLQSSQEMPSYDCFSDKTYTNELAEVCLST